MFGAIEMDCYGAIDFETEKCVLFVPNYDKFYQVWMTILTLDQFNEKYNLIDEIMYVDQMEEYFGY